MSPTCPYCDKASRLVGGSHLYPHRPDLFGKKFWVCDDCSAWVGCHPPKKEGGMGDGTMPLGRLANAELRKAKSAAHAAFDPLWRSRRMRRSEAYSWLAEKLGISGANCHIGMFDVDQCKAVVAVVRAAASIGEKK